MYDENHLRFYLDQGTSRIDVHHKTYHNATLNGYVDDVGSLVKISFKDPWYVDGADQAYYESPFGYRNLGMSEALFEEVENGTYNIGINSKYKGVFLDQGYNDPAKPYYKVKAPAQTININGSDHQMYFLNWESTNATLQDANSEKTGVVFHSDNAVVTANYKGSLLSSTENALSGTGQRKMVKAGSSHHLVYGSMNMVWYEKIDGSGSMNLVRGEDSNILSLSIYDAKHPAIDYSGSNTIVVFQEQYTPSKLIC